MNGLQGLGAAIVKFLWKIAVAIILVVFVAALVSWARGNPRQAQATTNKVMNAGASVIGWAADGVTSMTGGSAAEAAGADGVEVIMVQNEAPNRWHVGAAMRVWNKDLTGVQLKAGDCVSGLKCIKIEQVSDLPPRDGLTELGRTNFFRDEIKLNGSAAGQVSARILWATSCHELGHALGADHRTERTSCMSKVIDDKVSTRPDAKDFKTVNDNYGH